MLQPQLHNDQKNNPGSRKQVAVKKKKKNNTFLPDEMKRTIT